MEVGAALEDEKRDRAAEREVMEQKFDFKNASRIAQIFRLLQRVTKVPW